MSEDERQLNAAPGFVPKEEGCNSCQAAAPAVPDCTDEIISLLKGLQAGNVELKNENEELRGLLWEFESAQSRYAALYDYAPVGFFTLDDSLKVVDANVTGARLLEMDVGILADKSFRDFLADPQSQEILRLHLEGALSTRGKHICELRLKKGRGVFDAQLHTVAERHLKDTPHSFRTALIDITERKCLEAKLRQAHEALEARVAQRTRELTEVNERLSLEIEERKRGEMLLRGACEEIQQLKDRFEAENIFLTEEIDREYNFGEIIGQSETLKSVFSRIDQVAPQDTTVLILGETGSGKGVVARAIHSSSSRKRRPLVTVDCTSLPASLIESELFGHEKGAFTGSYARQMGRFEVADGGTIFLDEIGELPLELQPKLLRMIQDGEFERLGNPQTIKVNVRIIASTNRNLLKEVQEGRFRQDLFYRLNVFPITIPPLRQRLDDIELLVNYFVSKFNQKIGKAITTVPKETFEALKGYYWPGNIRELESVVERSVITSKGPYLRLPEGFKTGGEDSRRPEEVTALADMEKLHILQALKQTSYRIEGAKGAAAVLGLNPSTLRGRMRKLGISISRGDIA